MVTVDESRNRLRDSQRPCRAGDLKERHQVASITNAPSSASAQNHRSIPQWQEQSWIRKIGYITIIRVTSPAVVCLRIFPVFPSFISPRIVRHLRRRKLGSASMAATSSRFAERCPDAVGLIFYAPPPAFHLAVEAPPRPPRLGRRCSHCRIVAALEESTQANSTLPIGSSPARHPPPPPVVSECWRSDKHEFSLSLVLEGFQRSHRSTSPAAHLNTGSIIAPWPRGGFQRILLSPKCLRAGSRLRLNSLLIQRAPAPAQLHESAADSSTSNRTPPIEPTESSRSTM